MHNVGFWERDEAKCERGRQEGGETNFMRK
jgi:hypothetical protein